MRHYATDLPGQSPLSLSGRGRRSRPRQVAPRAAALIASLLLMAACGQGGGGNGGGNSLGVASMGSGTPTSTSGTSTKPSALAYSKCMRAHGLPDFPDPGSDGEVALHAGPGSDLSPDSPKFKAADSVCKPLLPPPSNGVSQADLKVANLKYAKCMRAHGISDFPDPKADGSLQIESKPGTDLDPNNPRFTSADDACKQYKPKGGGGTTVDQGSGS